MGNEQLLFIFLCYLSAVIVLGTTLTRYKTLGFHETRNYILFYIFLVFSYFALESYALYNTPFYVYPEDVYRPWGVMLPAMPLEGGTLFLRDFFNIDPVAPCMFAANKLVPLVVPIMEASLTYVIFCTVLQLKVPLLLLPLLVGLAQSGFDVFMDPVVATSFDCSGTPLENTHGIGLWQWHLPDTLANEAWFGVPLFNFGAWFSAPIILVALAQFLFWSHYYYKVRYRGHEEPLNHNFLGTYFKPKVRQGASLLAAVLAFGLIFAIGPTADGHDFLQVMILICAMQFTAYAVLWYKSLYDIRNKVKYSLVIVALLFLAYPLLIFMFNSNIRLIKDLWFVGLILNPILLFFILCPYTHNVPVLKDLAKSDSS